ncbi:MAG: hypothetical protein ABIX10_07430 [Acidimicrobiales bacterium]
MRRSAALPLWVVLTATTVWSGLATPASAGSTIPADQQWGGSDVVSPPAVVSPVTTVGLTGTIRDETNQGFVEPDVRLTMSRSADACLSAAVDATNEPAELYGFPARRRYDFSGSVPFAPERNGDYPVFVCIDGQPLMDTSIPVRLPAPKVANVVATASGRTITVSWDPTGAPDVSHRVERSVDSEAFSAVTLAGPGAVSFVDRDLPADSGEAAYRVIAVRPNVADARASNASAVTFEAAPVDPGGPGPSGATGDGPSGSGAGVAGSAASGDTGAGGSGRPGGSSSRRPGSSIGVPRVGTPSGSFFPPRLSPSGTEDVGFSEELPFEDEDDEEPGQQDAVLPEDGQASAPFDAAPGRGLMVPVATGLVLAVWAMHLRFLARAAKPQYVEPDELPDLVQW